MSIALSLIDRIEQLEKEVKKLRKELEKEIQDRYFYRQENLEPEKESPPFGSWIK